MYKEDAFHIGECFHQVACEIIPENWLDNEDDDGHWFVPSIVNMSFACELYLKSLLSDGISEFQGHNLEDLFNKLSEETKSSVLLSPLFKGDSAFYEKLSDAKFLFKDWRYFFETRKSACVDVVFLENFALVLHGIAESEVTHHDQL